MPNGTWKRSTATSRRLERQVRYAHVSVNVGVNKDEVTGMLVHTRTPRGEGSTATRAKPKAAVSKAAKRHAVRRGHDWAGIYPGRLASVEKIRRDRRNARVWSREEMRRSLRLQIPDAEALAAALCE